jgi:glycosyltransferase involved in cell wall biosynthesis
MTKKTIWILNHYAITPDLPGGTRHFDIARQLVKNGHRVVIMASSYLHGRYIDNQLPKGNKWKVETIDGVEFIWLKTFPYQRNDYKRYFNMISYMLISFVLGCRMRRLIPSLYKPDIIIGSSVHLLAVLSAWGLAKYYRAHFVMEVRDLWPQTIIDMGIMSSRHPVIIVLKILEKFLYKRAEYIIVLPPSAEEYICSLGIHRKKIIWIPNGVDLSRFPLITHNRQGKATFLAMYIGAFGQTNGVEVILQAAAFLQKNNFNSIFIQLIGDGSERDRLLQFSSEQALRNVLISKPVPKYQVSHLLSQADVLIHVEKDIPNLSKYGSSPNKLYDYMASGRPVVVASNFVLDPIENIGCGIKVPPNNPKALAQALVQISHLSYEEWQRMGQQARNYVEEYFSMAIIVDKINTFILQKLYGNEL